MSVLTFTRSSLPTLYRHWSEPAKDSSEADTVLLTPERRQVDRVRCSLYARCHEVRLLPRPPQAARVRDLSPGGLGLLVSRPFLPGSVLGIELQTATGTIEGRLRARVEHVTWLSTDRCWLLGCAAVG